MSRYETAAQCITQAGIEIGLVNIPPDPYGATSDQSMVQLCALLTSCGRELLAMREWQRLTVRYTIVTAALDSGDYPLPADYDRHIDQTDWNPTNRLPLGGPLSAQDWTALKNTNLASSTIYISFREEQGVFRILPSNPVQANQTINFEYQSRYWVATAAAPTVLAKDAPTRSDDVLLYNPILIQKFLKLRYLEAKKMDTTAASTQFENAIMSYGGQDKSAPTLDAARRAGFPYLGYRNIPETGYGQP